MDFPKARLVFCAGVAVSVGGETVGWVVPVTCSGGGVAGWVGVGDVQDDRVNARINETTICLFMITSKVQHEINISQCK
ncbi:MAG TPA: hypothetical protein DCX53_14775 [Anaerolineae bacterium]|nr:hypothetical protein [Anaerolineae bacterium]